MHIRGIKVDRLREAGLAESLLRAAGLGQQAIGAAEVSVRLLLQALGGAFQLDHLSHEYTPVRELDDGQRCGATCAGAPAPYLSAELLAADVVRALQGEHVLHEGIGGMRVHRRHGADAGGGHGTPGARQRRAAALEDAGGRRAMKATERPHRRLWPHAYPRLANIETWRTGCRAGLQVRP